MNALNLAELPILDWIQTYCRNGFLDAVLPFLSILVNKGIICIVLAIVLLSFKKTRKSGIVISIALTIGLIAVNLTLKPLVGRIRPYDMKEGVELLVARLSDASFPSGHTLACFEASFALLFCKHYKIAVPALVYSVIVAFSRLYLYVHYPTDVLAGAVLGILFALVAYLIVRTLDRKFDLDKRFSLLGMKIRKAGAKSEKDGNTKK